MRLPLSACLVLVATLVVLPAGAAEPAAPAAPAAKKRVAVLEFQGTIPPETLQVITDSARVGALDVANALGLVVMTRESMAAVMRDMGKNPGQCSEGDCEVETGRLIGADLVVTGTVTRVEARYVVTVKTHETQGGALLKSEQVDTADQFQLLASVKEATRRCLEPKEAAAAPSMVFSMTDGKDTPATVTGAIDAAYEGRRFAICSTLDTGTWTFCRGGRQTVTENQFARAYRQMTGLTDVGTRRGDWPRVMKMTALFTLAAGATTFLTLSALKADEDSRALKRAGDYSKAREREEDVANYALLAALSATPTGVATIYAVMAWTSPTDRPPTDHSLSLPAARGAVDRYNSALQEQLRHELGPRSEAAPRRDEPAVRVTPYLSPFGAGIVAVF